MRLTFEFEGVKEFDRAWVSLREQITDLRPVWPAVERAIQKIEDAQFKSEGAKGRGGKWKPLTRAYAIAKEKKYGKKPILQRTGALMRAMTSNTSDTIRIQEKDEFGYGTSLFYMPYVHKVRPVVNLSEDDKNFLTKETQKSLLAAIKANRTITQSLDVE